MMMMMRRYRHPTLMQVLGWRGRSSISIPPLNEFGGVSHRSGFLRGVWGLKGLLLVLLVLLAHGVLPGNNARCKRLSVQNPISLDMEAISIEPTGEMRMKIEWLSKI